MHALCLLQFLKQIPSGKTAEPQLHVLAPIVEVIQLTPQTVTVLSHAVTFRDLIHSSVHQLFGGICLLMRQTPFIKEKCHPVHLQPLPTTTTSNHPIPSRGRLPPCNSPENALLTDSLVLVACLCHPSQNACNQDYIKKAHITYYMGKVSHIVISPVTAHSQMD